MGKKKKYIYTVKQFLGKGGFAQVYKVYEKKTKKEYALKVIKKNEKEEYSIQEKIELNIHQGLDHENICKLVRYFESKDFCYFLLEFYSQGSLKELQVERKTLTHVEIKFFLYQLCQALQYLHKNRIIHRDIKTGNIFLDSKFNVKLGDFGLSVKVIQDQTNLNQSLCGTPNYMAPEIVGQIGYSYQVDIWAVGIIMYYLYFGTAPFKADKVKQTYDNILNKELYIPEEQNQNKHFNILLRGILNKDTSKRYTLQQILNSEYMNKDYIPRELPTNLYNEKPNDEFIAQYQQQSQNKQSKHSLITYSQKIDNLKKVESSVQILDIQDSNLNSKIQNDTKKQSTLGNKEQQSPLRLQNNTTNRQKQILQQSIKKKSTQQSNKQFIEDHNKENQDIQILKQKKKSDKKSIDQINLGIGGQSIQQCYTITSQIIYKGKILRYINQMSKYGVLYQTNEDIIGILFNDQSQLLYTLNSKSFKKVYILC